MHHLILLLILALTGCATRENSSETQGSFKRNDHDANVLNPARYPDINPHADISEDLLAKYQELWQQSNSSLKTQVDTPLYTNAQGCPNLVSAIKAANDVILHGAKCKAWFLKKNSFKSPKLGFKVEDTSTKVMCLATSAPAWGFPYLKRIGFCRQFCQETVLYLASIMIHEYAHHYCPITLGREECAIEAQEICGQEIANTLSPH